MAIDLSIGRRQAALCARNAEPEPQFVERRLNLERVQERVPYKDDPPTKTRIERPYLERNKRYKPFSLR